MNALHFLRLKARNAFNGRVRTPFSTLAAQAGLRSWGARIGEGLSVNGRLRLYVAGELEIGSRVRMNSGAPNNFVGGDRRMSLWIGPRGKLSIADGCALSNSTIVCTDRISIKEETFVGGGCEIYDTDFHPLDATARVHNSEPAGHGTIEIGPRAFIGGWTIVLKNVTIGEGAVVGAGSLVTGSIPPFELWAGVPARPIRTLK